MAANDQEQTGTRRLVIVESPAKAKTIAGYLGPGFDVEASVGHIRDLPTPSELPAAEKKGRFGKFAVDVDNDFEPFYVVDADKKKKVSELKRALKEADELFLATDEDREGEAIAWHLLQVLEPTVPVRRMVFHEITRDAIRAAVEQTRDLDQSLVDAQETRRILDRLYGYEVSPVLWRKVRQGLSAGRVQSVATRLVVERERERIAFRAASYWDVEATFETASSEGSRSQSFDARLVAVDGTRVATGRDFGSDGQPVARFDGVHLDEAAATSLADGLRESSFAVRSVEDKPYTRRPAAPFMTSTLQQEASRKLRMSAQTAMRVAQRLYENGYITYMRTDSTTLSESALNAARSQAREIYGPEYVPDVPRRYERKVKNAQEAHEAIRPSGDAFRTPGQVAGELSRDELALYDLIWKRTVASQMADARGQTATVRLGATSTDGRDAEFSVSGTVITFRGFLAAYEEGRDEDESAARRDDDEAERRLPVLRQGDPLDRARPASRRARHVAPRALHRGDPGAGAGGARHRPPVDVRLDPRHDHRPRLRLQARVGAGAVLAGVRDDRPAREALRLAGRLRLHRRDGGGPRPDRQRRPRTGSTGCAASTSAAGDGDPGPARAGVRLRRHRRPRGQLDPHRRRHHPAGRPLRPVRGARPGRRRVVRARVGAGGHGARRADRREGRGAARGARAATASSAPTRRPACRSSRRPVATGRTSPRCCRTTHRSPRSRAPARCSRRCRWTP